MVEKLFSLNLAAIIYLSVSCSILLKPDCTPQAAAWLRKPGEVFFINEIFYNAQSEYDLTDESHPFSQYLQAKEAQDRNNHKNSIDAGKRKLTTKNKLDIIKSRKRENEFLEYKKQNTPSEIPYYGFEIIGEYGLSENYNLQLKYSPYKKIDCFGKESSNNRISLGLQRALYRGSSSIISLNLSPGMEFEQQGNNYFIEASILYGNSKTFSKQPGKYFLNSALGCYCEKDILQGKFEFSQGYSSNQGYELILQNHIIFQSSSSDNSVWFYNKFIIGAELAEILDSDNNLPRLNISFSGKWQRPLKFCSDYGIEVGLWYSLDQ
jgi:hypothetical protein